MQTRTWNRHGRDVSFTEIGFGSAPLGNLYRAISDEEADAILEAAWEGGLRYYDTAPLYGFGLSETRLNRFLRGKPRGEYVLSTKVGRILKPVPPGTGDGEGKWFETPSRQEVYDYTYDGVMRSIEHSLERLGQDRIDILYAHDLDTYNQGPWEHLVGQMQELMDGGYRALMELRDQGVIAGFGAGVNQFEPVDWLMGRGDFDLFLLAGRYTLLDQTGLATMDRAAERGIGMVIGGAYNSGILATGPRPGAYYQYEEAPQEVLDRVARIQSICEAHGVALIDAAFRFPLLHPASVTVIPGGQGREEMARNIEAQRAEMPDTLWGELKSEGLVVESAPTP